MTIATVILSGGQDSTTCLFWAIKQYGVDNVRSITFNYGQRHIAEVESANTVAKLAGIKHPRHDVVYLGTGILAGTSPLTDQNAELEQYEDFQSMDIIIGDRVEKTFVPMRNALFLTVAANRAVVWGSTRLVTGVCQADNANYPDCRLSFIDDMRRAINTALGRTPFGGTKDDPTEDNYILIDTPLMDSTKAMSVDLAMSLPGCYLALAYTHTAYDGQYPPTGKDHATVLRAHGFEEAGVPDPLVLRAVLQGLMPAPATDNYSPAKVAAAVRHIKSDFAWVHGITDHTSNIRWWEHAVQMVDR